MTGESSISHCRGRGSFGVWHRCLRTAGSASVGSAAEPAVPGRTTRRCSLPYPQTTDLLHNAVGAGDGFSTMADGQARCTCSASPTSPAWPEADTDDGHGTTGSCLGGRPPIVAIVDQGIEVYLTLSTNVGMLIRPDLFDPHTVHLPRVPEGLVGLRRCSGRVDLGQHGRSADLLLQPVEPGPGTYMYHCHVEATEHMQMGMLGNLYVRPGFRTSWPDGDAARFLGAQRTPTIFLAPPTSA